MNTVPPLGALVENPLAAYKREIGIMVTVGIVLAVVTTGLAISLFPSGGPGVSTTESTGMPTSEVITSTSTSVSSSNQSTVAGGTVTTLPARCSYSQSQGFTSGTLVVGATSPAIICVQFYWFSSTPPITLDAMSLAGIGGYTQAGPFGGNDGSPINGANFTVAASQDQLLLGGPTNANEGTVVAYSITAKPGASGTYQVTVQGWQLGAQGVENCGPDGEPVAVNLVAGNGQPDYVYSAPGMCGAINVTGTNSTQAFSVPGVSYQIPSNVVLYRIISLTNSTQ
jgi:hypothetical protein